MRPFSSGYQGVHYFAVAALGLLEPLVLATHSAALDAMQAPILNILNNPNEYLESSLRGLLELLVKLEPAELAKYEEALQRCAKESKAARVREAATKTLSKLQASE